MNAPKWIKVRGDRTVHERVEVEVNPRDAFEELAKLVKARHGLSAHSYERNGKVVEDHSDGGGGHSWTDTVVVVELPTAEQLHALRTIDAMRDLVWKAQS